VQWNNIKECVSDTLSDLVGKVQKRARKPWITQEMIRKMDERRKWKNVNTKQGRKNYRRLRKKLKRATDNAKKEYLENTCNESYSYYFTMHFHIVCLIKPTYALLL
jgi:type I site-specific restriction endonuclease